MTESKHRKHPIVLGVPGARYYTIDLPSGTVRTFDTPRDAKRYAGGANYKYNRTTVLACAQSDQVFVCL